MTPSRTLCMLPITVSARRWQFPVSLVRRKRQRVAMGSYFHLIRKFGSANWGGGLLGVGIFVAGCALVREVAVGMAKSAEVATTVHKFMRGGLLREVRPPQRGS